MCSIDTYSKTSLTCFSTLSLTAHSRLTSRGPVSVTVASFANKNILTVMEVFFFAQFVTRPVKRFLINAVHVLFQWFAFPLLLRVKSVDNDNI